MLKVLICNAGSTSIKFKLWEMPDETVLAAGRVERIGMGGSIFGYSCPERDLTIEEKDLDIRSYEEGIQRFLQALTGPQTGALSAVEEIDAVGYKTVLAKGYYDVHLLEEPVLQGMREHMGVAPAHNGPYLRAIQVFRELLPGVPQVGAFETAFHRSIPEHRRLYALPWDWIRDYGIAKMGYHGASHSYVALRTGGKGRVVSCHLGGSSSLCAILDGKSVDNSFGLSLQTGIPHNNRVGDLDPYIILYLQEQGLSPEEISLGLRTRSGLKGISGLSGDMRDIEEAMDSGNSRAKLAFDMYADAVARYIGAYTVELGGLDQVVFTGGIGENSWRLRAEVLQKIACLGVSFDEEANRTLKGEGILSTPDSKVTVRVIPANEELMVVRAAYGALRQT